uniref:Uncharacterized protein n=1 Tax=Panagrolaimus sp. ES5 TaxID=591445 RepID=A0AC34GUJ4_9BILA
MQLFTICIFTFALAICYVKANEHPPHHASTSIAPDVSDRKKREEGPPHPTPRERRSIREKRQLPPNEPVTMHTPSPSRRKRNSETTTHMVHPVMEQADEMAEAIEESESAGVKKRDTEESVNASNDVEQEEEDATTMTTEITAVEKKEGDEEVEVIAASEDNVQGQIPRAKRVSHAGSSHKNRPSAVNRLQSNSNVGGNEEEEEQKDHEPEHEDVHHHDYEFDHIHTY